MEKTILALSSLYPLEMSALEEYFNVLKLWKEEDPEAIIQAHKDNIVAIIATMGRPVSRKMIEALPNLEIICNAVVGVDNIDLPAAQERGILVTNTPDVVTADTADIALALILCVMRRVCEADLYIRVGKWLNGSMPFGTSLSGKTVGIAGMGRIGRAIAKRVSACDMNIVYYGPREKDDISYPYYQSLQDMALACDCLVLSCPGGEDTENLVDYSILEALGADGVLINVARGSVVNEQDLLVALKNKVIAGAGLDVYEKEPCVPEELSQMDNVVLLPHIGTATLETRAKMGQLVIDNLLAYFNGKPLLTPFPMKDEPTL